MKLLMILTILMSVNTMATESKGPCKLVQENRYYAEAIEYRGMTKPGETCNDIENVERVSLACYVGEDTEYGDRGQNFVVGHRVMFIDAHSCETLNHVYIERY